VIKHGAEYARPRRLESAIKDLGLTVPSKPISITLIRVARNIDFIAAAEIFSINTLFRHGLKFVA
jgi:hypothetical protein